MNAAIRVGTRGSKLALVQTRAAIAALRAADPTLVFEETIIRTTGDAVADRPLAEIGGKGLFAKEIHAALLAGRIDLAVHSLKDLETDLPGEIALACPLPRADPRDVLLLAPGFVPPDPAAPFAAIPRNAVIGTASARREAQLRHARPDLRMTVLRGNVGTRIAKLAAGACDGTVLARAGLDRLGIAPGNATVLSPEKMLPAAGQGIVAVTCRADDKRLRDLLARAADAAATAAATAERAVLAALGGSCRTPIAAYAEPLPGGALRLAALTARTDGTFLLRRELRGSAADAAQLGAELGASLKADTPDDLFA